VVHRRVLFWSDWFWPSIGGVEVLATRFVREMQARGYELVVVTGTESDDPAHELDYFGLPVHRYPFAAALATRDLDSIFGIRRGLMKLQRDFQADLVHLFYVYAGAVFQRMTASASSAPVLVTLHGVQEDERLAPGSAIGPVLREADWLVACSAYVLRETRRQLPEVTERSSLIRNALELPDVEPPPLPFQPCRLLCLGRLVPEKGFDVGLEAFARLAGRFPSARLLIAGDGPQRPHLERRAADLQVRDRVEFLGWVPPERVPALLAKVTLVLCPSRSEPFGLAALQAGQMARPVVASCVGGLTEVVVDDQTGVLVEPERADLLAAAIEAILVDRARAARLGQAARERATAAFGWLSHVDAYEARYRDLVQRSER
jgi:glycogen(starch) synthase